MGQTTPAKYNDIQTWQVSLMPEGFAHSSFDPITLNRQFQVFLGKNQSNSSMVL